jgi:hypothetical protein
MMGFVTQRVIDDHGGVPTLCEPVICAELLIVGQ